MDDIGAGETHDEAYHRLRVCMGVSEEGESSLRFRVSVPSDWRRSALAAQVGETFLRIVGHLLDEVVSARSGGGHRIPRR